MKITISGTLGSGKSTVAKIISEKLNIKRFNSGGLMRQMAEERNMTLNELQEIAEKDRSVDDEIDRRQKELGEKENDFIFEGRLGYHFIPDSYKIFLKTDVEVAAERILKSMNEENKERQQEGLKKDKNEIINSLKKRRESEQKRYQELYDLNYEDETNYDLIIDTTNINAEEVSNKIIKEIKK
ncbi:cytidylate kinase family protein [Candidatus Woesearchaeota archaeon]|nr:cytidylate kinase family protein [Candidatus Woesearchaeota archaeon]